MTAGVLPAAVLAVCGPVLFSFVFGARWYEAGIYAALLAPWLLSFMVSNATAVLFRTLERQDLDLVANVLLLLVRLLSLLVGARIYGDPIIAIALMSFSSAAVNFWRVYLLLRLSGAHSASLLGHALRQLVCVLPAVGLIWLADAFLGLPALAVLGAAALGSMSYAALSLHRDSALQDRLQNILPGRR